MKRPFTISGLVLIIVIIVVYFLFARNHNDVYIFKFDKMSQGDMQGKPLYKIMVLLGHSQISTTQKYLQLLP